MLNDLINMLSTAVGQAIAAGVILLPVIVTWHVLKTKKDVRSAIGWIGFSWFVPIIGSIFYFLLGINRLKRKASRVRRLDYQAQLEKVNNPSLDNLMPNADPDMVSHSHLIDKLMDIPLTAGNKVTPLINGEQAFPEMLMAIESAKSSIALATYIFKHDDVGEKFATALGRAALRGVKTYVLIDGIGDFYHLESVSSVLRKSGVKVRRFNRTFLPWNMAYLNLRNHRKIMVVDGTIGFTGGMNLRAGSYNKVTKSRAMRDLHFKLIGPVVGQLMEVFAEDWLYSAKEKLEGKKWFPPLLPIEGGEVIARGLPDGPDEDIDSLTWTLISALSMAQRSVRIMTPYFLPERLLLNALNHAALRGVKVEILLPEKSNLRFVDWASWAQFEHILEFGCDIILSPPPFDHSKLMIVDEDWVLIGSTNWDARSLRLNFEFDVECYDKEFSTKMISHFEEIKSQSRLLGKEEVRARNPFKRLRDGLFWLLSPYL